MARKVAPPWLLFFFVAHVGAGRDLFAGFIADATSNVPFRPDSIHARLDTFSQLRCAGAIRPEYRLESSERTGASISLSVRNGARPRPGEWYRERLPRAHYGCNGPSVDFAKAAGGSLLAHFTPASSPGGGACREVAAIGVSFLSLPDRAGEPMRAAVAIEFRDGGILKGTLTAPLEISPAPGSPFEGVEDGKVDPSAVLALDAGSSEPFQPRQFALKRLTCDPPGVAEGYSVLLSERFFNEQDRLLPSAPSRKCGGKDLGIEFHGVPQVGRTYRVGLSDGKSREGVLTSPSFDVVMVKATSASVTFRAVPSRASEPLAVEFTLGFRGGTTLRGSLRGGSTDECRRAVPKKRP